MISKISQIPVTDFSHPFCSAIHRCKLAESNYEEVEYLFSGTANIYEGGETGIPTVKFENCDYTDRMIIRKPIEDTACNGKVIVEVINTTANFDIERIWSESYRYLMRHGYVYVGITSKPNVFKAFQTFDMDRYGELSWPNPDKAPDPFDTDTIYPSMGPNNQEVGQIWDILRDISILLRSDDDGNPLKNCSVSRLVLAGWSQSTFYLNRMIMSFLNTGLYDPDLYDGFLRCGGSDNLAPLNRYEASTLGWKDDLRVLHSAKPFLDLKTESENSNLGHFRGYDIQRPDSNIPGHCYHYLEIAGACHDAAETFLWHNDFDTDVGRSLGGDGSFKMAVAYPDINDYPKHFAFHMAVSRLFDWMESGRLPAPVPRIRESAEGINLRDAFGNAIGGLRTPLIDLPIARYRAQATRFNFFAKKEAVDYLAGCVHYYSAELINELYGDAANYKKLVTENVQFCVAQGMLLAEDAAEMIELAVSRAVEHGLQI